MRHLKDSTTSMSDLGARRALASLGLTIEEVVGTLEMRPGWIAYLGGSTAEGLANSQSDIDVYVVCDERPIITEAISARHHWVAESHSRWYGRVGEPLVETFDYLNDDGLAVNACYVTRIELERQVAAIDGDFKLVSEVFDTVPWPSYSLDFAFVHRLNTSLAIVGAPELDILKQGVDQPKFNYVLHKRTMVAYEYMKDIIGAWRASELVLCAGLVEKYLISSCQSYLCLLGFTNPNQKWLWKYAEQAKPPAHSVLGRARECIFTDRRTENQAREFIELSLQLIDQLHVLGREAIDGISVFPSSKINEQRIHREIDRLGQIHPQSVHELIWWLQRYVTEPRSSASFL